MEILRCAKKRFFVESSLAASAEEAVDLAQQTALQRVPCSERMILAVMLYIMMGSEDSYESTVTFETSLRSPWAKGQGYL
ncbi:MAG: hypothetical protein HFF84_13280 [Oscillibacter sp.]|nr:hypothetical protein [Oscillibacter sp.]